MTPLGYEAEVQLEVSDSFTSGIPDGFVQLLHLQTHEELTCKPLAVSLPLQRQTVSSVSD